jgi:hypothetical protein
VQERSSILARGRVHATARTRRQRVAPLRPRTAPRDGFLCLDPRIFPPAYRPQPLPCVAPQIRYPRPGEPVAPASGINKLLDIANDGTFADARRAAILGHQNPDATAYAINGLVRASQDGRISEGFAAERIAQLASPPVAAAQADQIVRPLTPDELAARRRAKDAGLSDSELAAKVQAKLEETCRPKVCWIEKDVRGRPIVMNFSTGRSREDIMQERSFLRFCTADDLKGQGVPPESWGMWLISGLRRTASGLGLPILPPEATTAGVPLGPAPEGGPLPPSATGAGQVAPPPPGGYLCLDPRIFPPAFRQQSSPCVAPQIPYPGT